MAQTLWGKLSMINKILLVTLVHNRKEYLDCAFKSVEKQILPSGLWDYLIVDNGSVDGNENIINKYCSNNINFFVKYVGENIGQQKAYNWVLQNWSDKYDVMAILDSDDFLEPCALESIFKTFGRYRDIGQTYSGFNVVDSVGNIKIKNHRKSLYVREQNTCDGQKRLRRAFINNNPIGHMRAFRIDCLKDIGGFNEDYLYATDYNIAGRMLEKYKVLKIHKILYNWRQHDNQIESVHAKQQHKDFLSLQQYFRSSWEISGLT